MKRESINKMYTFYKDQPNEFLIVSFHQRIQVYDNYVFNMNTFSKENMSYLPQCLCKTELSGTLVYTKLYLDTVFTKLNCVS